ncbi:hypothetical protein D9M68_435110 [compost metagenome]
MAVDQEKIGAAVIDETEHGEAREPRHVGFPFEPGEMLRHRGRRHQVFLDVVEAAAMHLPLLAIGADRQVVALREAEVERDEIEG